MAMAESKTVFVFNWFKWGSPETKLRKDHVSQVETMLDYKILIEIV